MTDGQLHKLCDVNIFSILLLAIVRPCFRCDITCGEIACANDEITAGTN